jgi:phosphatidylcholine synthase
MNREPRSSTPLQIVLAASVHLFTALGIVCALLAMQALIDGNWRAMFLWLTVALVIDGIDGTFARAADVHRHVPRFSGEQLDLVVDYVTYVFVPALALLRAGYLPPAGGLLLTSLILLSSLYHFADTASKSEDKCFVGFPAIWNIVAFYVFAFDAGPLPTTAIVLVCVVLTFVPRPWMHPMRLERHMALNLTVTLIGTTAALWVLWTGFPGDLPSRIALVGAAAYCLWPTLQLPRVDPRGRR